MASTYPTSLDAFTNPLAADLMTSPSHAQQHSDINDAVEALEAKVAIGNTVLGTYTAYTPTWINLTVGNGTQNFKYARVNNLVHVNGYLIWGSTTSITGAFVNLTIPVLSSAVYSSVSWVPFGEALFFDTSGNSIYQAEGVSVTSNSVARLRMVVTSGTNVLNSNITSTTPFTWATGDQMAINFTYEAA